MNDLRLLLLRALLLDWLGQVLILALLFLMPAWTGIALGGDTFQGQMAWLIFMLLLTPWLRATRKGLSD